MNLSWTGHTQSLRISIKTNYFYAPNLRGAAEVAAIQLHWKEGHIVPFVPRVDANGFRLYKVRAHNGQNVGEIS